MRDKFCASAEDAWRGGMGHSRLRPVRRGWKGNESAFDGYNGGFWDKYSFRGHLAFRVVSIFEFHGDKKSLIWKQQKGGFAWTQ